MTVTTRLCDMPTGIKGFVRHNNDDSYTIVINSRLSYDIQRECYKHEMAHLQQGDFDHQELDVDDIEVEAHGREL